MAQHVDPEGLEALIQSAGISERMAKQLRKGNEKPAVGTGSAERPEIDQI